MSELTVRPYRPGDLDEVVAVWRESKRAAYPYVAAQQSYTAAQDTAYFRDIVAIECSVWLADHGGAVVGLLALNQDFIDQLFVAPQHQRTGVGSSLLARAKEHSPQRLRLRTFARNTAARAFWERHGFRVVGYGVSAPPENEPDIVYEWRARTPSPGP